MKTFEFFGRPILCGKATDLNDMIAIFSTGETVSIVDLRTVLERPDEEDIDVPDTWNVRRLPVRGRTISEQDLDVFRREFFRHPKTLVIGPNAARAELMLLASVARAEVRPINEAELRDVEDKHEERDLLDWLTRYLKRHQSGPEKDDER